MNAQPNFDETEFTVRTFAELQGEAESLVHATPFILPDHTTLPRRRWLIGKWLLRGEVSAIIAPAGVGKSTFTVAKALSLASGIDFLRKGLPEGARRVWLWNLEDDRTELTRQIAGAASQHGLSNDDIGDRLLVDGLDNSLCTAIETPTGAKLVEPVYVAIVDEIKRRQIDVLIVDPFVSSHAIGENDNNAMDKVAKAWKRVAQECDCAIVLVHHTRKTGGFNVTVEDARGASALIGAVRIGLTLNRMQEDEATSFGIIDPAERRSLVRVDMGKSNRAPAGSAYWFKLVSVDLANGDFLHPSDHVGAAIGWNPPDAFDGLTTRDLYNVQQAVAAGEWQESIQAKKWAGCAIADVLGLDLDDGQQKAKAATLLKTWIKEGALKVHRRDKKSKGRETPFVVVGNPIDPATLPTLKSEVGEGGEGGGNITSYNHPTPPL